MKITRNQTFVRSIATIVLAASSAQASTVAVSTGAPTVDGADIGMLTSTDNDFQTSILWSDRGARGQTLTTGSDTGGYTINSFTLQAAAGTDNDGTYAIRLGTISGTAFTSIASDSMTTIVDVAVNDYVTFTFTAPVSLNANTLYGFDVSRSSGSGWQSFRNTDNNSYTGGVAYSSGDSGLGGATISTHANDRVFHLDIVAVPEPSATALIGLDGLALILRRRK